MAEISVFIPIFNGARFLDETLQSLLGQTFCDFEAICIDDCSTDNSAAIVARYMKQDARIKLVTTPKNLGTAPKSLNFAAKTASGSWFVYSSQDDLYSEDWLEKLHQRAIETNADAVVPDLVTYYSRRKSTYRVSGFHGDRSVIISGRDAFIASLDWSIPGNALWPMHFLRDGGFDEFGAFADEFTVRRFFLKCKTVAFCDSIFFYRQDNPLAVTKNLSEKLLDIPNNNLHIWRLIVDSGFGDELHSHYALLTLRSVAKAKFLAMTNGPLQKYVSKVDDVWYVMRMSTDFQKSLALAIGRQRSKVKSFIYTRASRSLFWLILYSKISGHLRELKHGKRRFNA